MSKHASNDPETRGYFLPEDSRFRLKQLRDHMQFLSRLAQPRTQRRRKRAPEVRAADFAVPLALLAEQADRVLEEVSWPARLDVAAEAPERDTVAATSPEMPDTAVERFDFGVTVEQIDALDRLVEMISAHSDVMAAGAAVELADHTVSVLGQAIHNGAKAARDVLDQMEAQRLGHMPRRSTSVGEARAVYGRWHDGPDAANPIAPAVESSLDYAELSRRVH